nr:MAG TPA: hypothetical protein [Caudoviricetes sp.]
MAQTSFKRFPFNIELAKKITNKEVKGRIVTKDGRNAKILCWDMQWYGTHRLVALVEDVKKEIAISCYLNGKRIDEVYNWDSFDLYLEMPTCYKDYSNFVPQKWQPCLVRDSILDYWIVKVCKGIDAYGEPFFFSDGSNKDCFLRWVHVLPLSKITERLIGTTKSYGGLIKELDDGKD